MAWDSWLGGKAAGVGGRFGSACHSRGASLDVPQHYISRYLVPCFPRSCVLCIPYFFHEFHVLWPEFIPKPGPKAASALTRSKSFRCWRNTRRNPFCWLLARHKLSAKYKLPLHSHAHSWSSLQTRKDHQASLPLTSSRGRFHQKFCVHGQQANNWKLTLALLNNWNDMSEGLLIASYEAFGCRWWADSVHASRMLKFLPLMSHIPAWVYNCP